ncbi:recombinase family protein [Amycolatopsis sp. NPDC059657]|uniref:recombinase family protein n=1 Tax=Amycolatopsis sp. NPDC059657 TaxID=3346899 RepID=UPI00366C094D
MTEPGQTISSLFEQAQLTAAALTPVTASGPSGLSDYAVSPLGMPAALLRDEVRVAFLGRTSTEDQQDPRQSMLRQLGNCKPAIPESWVIVAHFYDVESGRMDLDARGHGDNYERFDIPIARDGGIADLLDEATRADRRFDVVICEGISRVARRAFEGLSVERALDLADVPLFASNEPIMLSGSRAQRILQRRINQSVAEYEVLNTLEMSWGGLCTHVREGWNIGKPPYGYRAKSFRHPNPVKAAKGLTKSRLEPDGLAAETVTQIALWRYHEQLGYGEIADKLNADPTKYPPPAPTNKARARGAWGKTTVYEILKNPKYTGYQVFNRRARRSRGGKVNDQVKWVWSVEPAHSPLIPKQLYDQLNARSQANRGSRPGNAPNSHPATKRTYLFRSRAFCDCNRRMEGCIRHDAPYYKCAPRNNNRGRPDKWVGHPKTVYIRENALLNAVARFFADRVFGPERRELLAADLNQVDDRATLARQAERERLQRLLAELERKQAGVLRQAQDGDPGDPFTKALRGSYNDLEAQKSTPLTRLAELDAADKADPTQLPSTEDVALLDALPYLALNLANAPEPQLQALSEATQLEIRLHDDTDHVTITIRLPAKLVPEIAHTAERISDPMSAQEVPAQRADSACVDAVRAPDRVARKPSSIRDV